MQKPMPSPWVRRAQLWGGGKGGKIFVKIANPGIFLTNIQQTHSATGLLLCLPNQERTFFPGQKAAGLGGVRKTVNATAIRMAVALLVVN